jgi:hydrogenase expression/formation protein HypD
MFNIEKLRDGGLCSSIAREISAVTENIPGRLRFMEVCGTHTHAFFRYGLRSMLTDKISLLSGPGCPVCVTPVEYVDKALYYAKLENHIIVTFGDLFRVPGSRSSLEKAKALGADIRVVYSPLESLKFAADNRDRKIVFLAVGFETTIPAVAATLLEARKKGLDNWSMLTGHKLITPAMKALVQNGRIRIDGFLCPGHVSAIIGSEPYRFLSRDYGIPCVITGFEPADILQGLLMLARMRADNKPGVLIQYSRAVREEGNPRALEIMERVFGKTRSNWRGIGVIPASGLKLKGEYARFDIEKTEKPGRTEPSREIKGCICGEILCGVKTPADCRLFGGKCTPENPVGACMVSSEGACAAYFKYRD